MAIKFVNVGININILQDRVIYIVLHQNCVYYLKMLIIYIINQLDQECQCYNKYYTQFQSDGKFSNNHNTMAQILKQYSLTQYTDFRKLQFQYVKIKDENQQNKHRLNSIQILLQNNMKQMADLSFHKSQLEKQKRHKNNEEQEQKGKIIDEINQIMDILSSSGKERNNRAKVVKADSFKSIRQVFKILRHQVQILKAQLNKTNGTLLQLISQSEKKQKNWEQRQQIFSSQIAQLQIDLKTLQKLQSQLQIQNEKILKRNEELASQIKSYKAIAIQARNSRTPVKTEPVQLQTDFNQDDKDFATDLLGYQKQLLSRVFALVINSFNNNDIQISLRKIYEAYEQVIECFRQKLQIEYDLSDLECQYQKRKLTSQKQVVVELRKQINNFRKQLFTQKQFLQKKQVILQERINELSGQAMHDNRLKNFSIDLQAKYRKHKQLTQQNELQHVNKNKESSIEFRQTLTADQMVKQMIQKDRQNLQKMLKQTRNQFRK